MEDEECTDGANNAAGDSADEGAELCTTVDDLKACGVKDESVLEALQPVLDKVPLQKAACRLLSSPHLTLSSALHAATQLRTLNLSGVRDQPTYVTKVLRAFRDRVRVNGCMLATKGPLALAPSEEWIKTLSDEMEFDVTVDCRKVTRREAVKAEPSEPEPSSASADQDEAPKSVEYLLCRLPPTAVEDFVFNLLLTRCDIRPCDINLLRVPMCPVSGTARGYAHVHLEDKEKGARVPAKLNGYEISPGVTLKVKTEGLSSKRELVVRTTDADESDLLRKLRKLDGLLTAPRFKPGICFVTFDSYESAASAKDHLSEKGLPVDWARPRRQPINNEGERRRANDQGPVWNPKRPRRSSPTPSSSSKTMRLWNVPTGSISDDELVKRLGAFGEVADLKRSGDEALVEFPAPEQCAAAIKSLHGAKIGATRLGATSSRLRTRRIRIQNLADTLETGVLLDRLADAGTVLKVDRKEGKDEAVVHFATVDECEKALSALEDTVLNDKHIEASLIDDDQHRPDAISAAQSIPKHRRHSIRIGNLDISVQDLQIEERLKEFGEVLELRRKGQSAFVDFATERECEKVGG